MNEPVTHAQLTSELDKFRGEIRTEIRADMQSAFDQFRVEVGRMILASEENLRGQFQIMLELLGDTKRELAEHRTNPRIHEDLALELDVHRRDTTAHGRSRRRAPTKRAR